MLKNCDYIHFLIHDVILPSLVYILGIIIFIVLQILKIDNYTIISFLIKYKTGISIPTKIAMNNCILILIEIIIILLLCYLTIRKINKDKVFHDSGLGYLDWPFWCLTLVGKILCYRYINTVNIPIWLQFKIYKSSFWNTHLLNSEDINHSNDESKVFWKKMGNNRDVVNVILMDTYPILNKIPKDVLNKYDNLIIKRKKLNDFSRTFNEKFVNKSISEINKLYKSPYNHINLFCSTNPIHTKKIFEGSFKMDVREKHISVTIFQSVGKSHIYKDSHKVIK